MKLVLGYGGCYLCLVLTRIVIFCCFKHHVYYKSVEYIFIFFSYLTFHVVDDRYNFCVLVFLCVPFCQNEAGENTIFIKIHVPWETMLQYAEVLKFKKPVKVCKSVARSSSLC